MENFRESFVQGFLSNLDILSKEIGDYPRLRYAVTYHKNIRGDAMQFHDKPYLKKIYTDNNPNIVLQSSVQTGKSEFLIISSLSWAEIGLQVLYVLPTIETRNNFVGNRVDRQLQASDYYKAQLRAGTNNKDSTGLKHFGKGTIFFAGSNSATTFVEKPIDLVIGDEIDLFDQANYEKADDRMTASPYKLKYEASNPTVDNYGINRSYLASNQCSWMIKCKRCNQWQELDWYKNAVRQIDENEYVLQDREWKLYDERDINIFCIRCHMPLERFEPGLWVPKNRLVRGASGYHIHQLLSSFVRVDTMWKKFREALESDIKMQVFFNSILGRTFAGKGAKINDEILSACKEPYLMPYRANACVMGIDVGKRLNVVIREICPGEKLRLVFAGTVREFEDCEEFFARFNIVSFVVDAMPETRKATEFVQKHPYKGWICRYVNGLKELNANEDERTVSADRTMLMDKVQNFFKGKRNINPKNAQDIDSGDYHKQLKIPTRVYNEEKNRFDWLGDPDHYFHAEVYCNVAYALRGEFRIIGLQPGGGQTFAQPPDEFDESMFPPGTDQSVIDFYRNAAKRKDDFR